ncbi:hypothetical protein C457_11366 [Haloferax prahovense DSM 18310]|uniref:Uncharacterized protein n=1 Tax=Haloferax prahovense (strain DSM 18310 / JCM 13924 / TL6) TaxID=1227461 RepID=M0G8S7_HALPT|nr:hypothetical protein [Haloferax prahovense]ELZ68600.1 hypothetical protein C457_11366 [Haloferax prahovense DSM 18310]
MKLGDLPVISTVFEAGADDRIFDSLLLVGPLIIGLIIILNRSFITEALAGAYIIIFVIYVLYRGIQYE